MAAPLTPPAPSAWRAHLQAEGRARPDPWTEQLAWLRGRALDLHLEPGLVAVGAEWVALAPSLPAEDRRALLILMCILHADLRAGSACTPLSPAHLAPRFAAWVGLPADAEALHQRARALLEPGACPALVGPDRRPLTRVDDRLYLARVLEAERRLAESMAARLGGRRPEAAQPALTEVLADPAGGLRLSEEQRRCVLAAATGGLTLISGGPGTGKTSIVVALLRVLVRLGVPPDAVALTAPTGKAAWRMGEAIQTGLMGLTDPQDARLRASIEAPRTLHRLLRFSPATGRYGRHPNAPLRAQVVVVDEASMVDLFLMERLLRALPTSGRLVLLGDADQLPSVAAGAVFSDALKAVGAYGAAVRLTHSYRMRAEDPAGRAILGVARRLNAGRAEVEGPELATVRARPADLTGRGAELLWVDAADLSPFLGHWYERHARVPSALAPEVDRTWAAEAGRLVEPDAVAPLFQHAGASRLLCLTHGGPRGAQAVNAALHARAARHRPSVAGLPLLVGEPVVVTRNDYDRDLFNGDQGLILWVRAEASVEPMLAVSDGSGVRVFPLAGVRAHLQLAYAMTVHKAQGSEFDRVAVLLPVEEGGAASRALLYTALTRARTGALLVGSARVLAAAARRRVRRHGGLAQSLRLLVGGAPAPEME